MLISEEMSFVEFLVGVLNAMCFPLLSSYQQLILTGRLPIRTLQDLSDGALIRDLLDILASENFEPSLDGICPENTSTIQLLTQWEVLLARINRLDSQNQLDQCQVVSHDLAMGNHAHALEIVAWHLARLFSLAPFHLTRHRELVWFIGDDEREMPSPTKLLCRWASWRSGIAIHGLDEALDARQIYCEVFELDDEDEHDFEVIGESFSRLGCTLQLTPDILSSSDERVHLILLSTLFQLDHWLPELPSMATLDRMYQDFETLKGEYDKLTVQLEQRQTLERKRHSAGSEGSCCARAVYESEHRCHVWKQHAIARELLLYSRIERLEAELNTSEHGQ